MRASTILLAVGATVAAVFLLRRRAEAAPAITVVRVHDDSSDLERAAENARLRMTDALQRWKEAISRNDPRAAQDALYLAYAAARTAFGSAVEDALRAKGKLR